MIAFVDAKIHNLSVSADVWRMHYLQQSAEKIVMLMAAVDKEIPIPGGWTRI